MQMAGSKRRSSVHTGAGSAAQPLPWIVVTVLLVVGITASILDASTSNELLAAVAGTASILGVLVSATAGLALLYRGLQGASVGENLLLVAALLGGVLMFHGGWGPALALGGLLVAWSWRRPTGPGPSAGSGEQQ